MVDLQIPCRAKNPSTCKFHGALLRMNDAAAKGDLDAYFEARTQVEEDILLGWDDETQRRAQDYIHDTVDTTITIPKMIEGLKDVWENYFNSLTDSFDIEWYGTRFGPKPYITFLANHIEEEEFNNQLPTYTVEPYKVPGLGELHHVESYWGTSNKAIERIWFVFEVGGRYFMVEGERDPVTTKTWANDPVEVKYRKVVKAVINNIVEPLK